MISTQNDADAPALIPHNATLYKTPGTKNSQADRRLKLLQAIKERRNASMDEKRHIDEVFTDNDNTHAEQCEFMETTVTHNKRKNKKQYANKLMLSEWLIEKPFDFEAMWIMKVCPTGVRNLVVAYKGKTKSFSKSGHFIRQFQSQLPGGSGATPMRFTILDCVFQQEENTYYVLDVLVWNSYSVMNSSSEFRFFFIESKLQEIDLQTVNKGNEHKIQYAPHKTADVCTIGEAFSHFIPGIDGILFYHSEVSYLSQVTPLVGWLKVYMVPEVLDLPVHASYLLEKPENYTNFVNYVQNFDKFERKRHRRRRKDQNDVEMIDFDDNTECGDNVDVEEAVMDV